MADSFINKNETFKDLRIDMQGVPSVQLEKEIMKGRILDAALADLAKRPDFDPLAISVVFGLKW